MLEGPRAPRGRPVPDGGVDDANGVCLIDVNG
jgi:hypothetical protein